jgi:hypothetical protein
MQTNFRKRTKLTDSDLRFRAPKEIIKALERKAERNGRSRTAEILDRLAWSLEVESTNAGVR